MTHEPIVYIVGDDGLSISISLTELAYYDIKYHTKTQYFMTEEECRTFILENNQEKE